MSKLSNLKKSQIIDDYQSGRFTRYELADIYSLSRSSIDRVLNGVKKPFKYDAFNKAISLDQLKAKGQEIADYSYEPLAVLTKEPEYSKMVKCPSCNYCSTADRLLGHLINKHHRFDLEYLL